MGFSKTCKEMLRAHMHDWIFARVTRVHTKSPNFYYGFAREESRCCRPCSPRAIWFKGGRDVPTLVLGPVLLSTSHVRGPPAVGTLLLGRVVQNRHIAVGRGRGGAVQRNLNRFDWWYRDAAPLSVLWDVAHGAGTPEPEALCKATRYLPNTTLDNLWAFIRLIEDEDIQSFVTEYQPLSNQPIHPVRGSSGKPGYLLDRPSYRFILDTAIFFGMPCIYDIFAMRMQQQKMQLELTPRLHHVLSQEILDFKESVVIYNNSHDS